MEQNQIDESGASRDEQVEEIGSLAHVRKPYQQHVFLFYSALETGVFSTIEDAIKKLKYHYLVPDRVWLEYIKLLIRTAGPSGDPNLMLEKLEEALSECYNRELAEIMFDLVKDLEPLPNQAIWQNLLNDYGLYSKKIMDGFCVLITDGDNLEEFAESVKRYGLCWSCSPEQLEEVRDLTKNFEEKMLSINNDLDWQLEQYLARASELTTCNNTIKHSVIRYFYEVAVGKYPNALNIWYKYIEQSDRLRRSSSDVGFMSFELKDLFVRAMKMDASIWIGRLFLQLMTSNEDYVYVEDTYKDYMLTSSNDIQQTVDANIDLLTHIVHALRYITEEDQYNRRVNEMRQDFRNVWNELSEKFGNEADPTCEVLQLWADVEYGKLENPDGGAELWEEILSYDRNVYNLNMWMTYIKLEDKYGDIYRTRSVYQSALSKLDVNSADFARLVREYRRWECCNGDEETMMDAMTAINNYCAAERKQESESSGSETDSSGSETDSSGSETDSSGSATDEPPASVDNSPTKVQKSPTKVQKSPTKVQKSPTKVQMSPTKVQKSPTKVQKSPTKVQKSPTEVQKSPTKVQKSPTKVQMSPTKVQKSPTEVQKSPTKVQMSPTKVQMSPKLEKSTTVAEQQAIPPKENEREGNFSYSNSKELNKLFLKNLHPKCTQEELMARFSPYGSIKDIRLVYRLNKAFKGIAYIDFEDAKDAAAALREDGTELAGKIMSVSISDPPQRSKKMGETEATPQGSSPSNGATKRKFPSSLIPTALIKNEVQRRKRLEMFDTDEAAATSSSASASESTAAIGSPPKKKTNADFQQLMNEPK